MSHISHLQKAYSDSEQVRQLAALLAQPRARVELTGLHGGSEAFVVAGAIKRLPKLANLLIASTKDEAAYLQNDLEGILGDSQIVHFFPDSFKRPADFQLLNPTQILQRSELVSQLSEKNAAPPIVVTYPEALFERVVKPEVLAAHRIEIVKGEKLDVDFAISVLVEFGFERADFVYEPGQFSVRGGILDLFSFGNEWPYRIELFDDEVETIRLFDPLTQLSQRNLERVGIVPNLNTQFRQSEKVPLLHVLPLETVVWVRDFQFVLDRLNFCFERAEAFSKQIAGLDDVQLREIFRDRAFVFPGDVVAELVARPIVLLDGGLKILQREHPSLF